MMRHYVLDANALTGFFEGRAGLAVEVARLLAQAAQEDVPVLMSAVNWGEVFYITSRRHGEAEAWKTEARLQELPIAVIAADRQRASRAGSLKQKHGLGYTDSFAAELAMERGAWLVSADPEFAKVGRGLAVVSLPRHEK